MTVSNARSVASMNATVKLLAEIREMLVKRMDEVRELADEHDDKNVTMSWDNDRRKEEKALDAALNGCDTRSLELWCADVESAIKNGRP